MDPCLGKTDESRCNKGLLKVNLSAVSFYEKSVDNSDYFTNLYKETFGNFFKNKEEKLNDLNSCKSSSCYVVFSIKLCSKNKNLKNYWSLCSEVITRPIFVKYKKNKNGFVSFLINHTETLPFKNIDRSKSSQLLEDRNTHFDSLLNSNKFLISFGISIVKKSTLLYVGYGNKYLSAVELFGKRLSLEISEDDDDSNILKLNKGLLFFDVYIKKSHLAPNSHKLGLTTNLIEKNNFEHKLKEALSTKGLEIEELLKDKKFFNTAQIEDYSSSSTSLDSVSELSTLEKKTKKYRKPKLPFKLEEETNGHVSKIFVPDSVSSVQTENCAPPQKSNLTEDNYEKIDEHYSQPGEVTDGCTQCDKYLNSVKISYRPEFIKLVKVVDSQKYAKLSQKSMELFKILNIDTYKLKSYENSNSTCKFNDPKLNTFVKENNVEFKLLLKFLNKVSEGKGVSSTLDSALKEIFCFLNNVFSVSNTVGYYDLVSIRTRSMDRFDNIIKIPISKCGEKIADVFEYLSKIDIRSVLGVSFLLSLKVDLFRMNITLSILEEKMKMIEQLKIPLYLYKMDYGLDFSNLEPFEDDNISDPSNYENESHSAISDDTPISLNPEGLEINQAKIEYTGSNISQGEVAPDNYDNEKDQQPKSDTKWTNLMKNEVNVIRTENALQEEILRFIWPPYSKNYS